jgi:hypothetical protein
MVRLVHASRPVRDLNRTRWSKCVEERHTLSDPGVHALWQKCRRVSKSMGTREALTWGNTSLDMENLSRVIVARRPVCAQCSFVKTLGGEAPCPPRRLVAARRYPHTSYTLCAFNIAATGSSSGSVILVAFAPGTPAQKKAPHPQAVLFCFIQRQWTQTQEVTGAIVMDCIGKTTIHLALIYEKMNVTVSLRFWHNLPRQERE